MSPSEYLENVGLSKDHPAYESLLEHLTTYNLHRTLQLAKQTYEELSNMEDDQDDRLPSDVFYTNVLKPLNITIGSLVSKLKAGKTTIAYHSLNQNCQSPHL